MPKAHGACFNRACGLTMILCKPVLKKSQALKRDKILTPPDQAYRASCHRQSQVCAQQDLLWMEPIYSMALMGSTLVCLELTDQCSALSPFIECLVLSG